MQRVYRFEKANIAINKLFISLDKTNFPVNEPSSFLENSTRASSKELVFTMK